MHLTKVFFVFLVFVSFNAKANEAIKCGYYYTYDDTWTDPNAITTIEGTGYYPQATINFLIGATVKF